MTINMGEIIFMLILSLIPMDETNMVVDKATRLGSGGSGLDFIIDGVALYVILRTSPGC